MDDLKPKFIIEKGEFKLGKVHLHQDLASNPKDVSGGGWFHFELKAREIYLYGSSLEFGILMPEQIIEPLKNDFKDKRNLNGFKVFHVFIPHTGDPELIKKVKKYSVELLTIEY